MVLTNIIFDSNKLVCCWLRNITEYLILFTIALKSMLVNCLTYNWLVGCRWFEFTPCQWVKHVIWLCWTTGESDLPECWIGRVGVSCWFKFVFGQAGVLSSYSYLWTVVGRVWMRTQLPVGSQNQVRSIRYRLMKYTKRQIEIITGMCITNQEPKERYFQI